jgi:hypothetical protein
LGNLLAQVGDSQTCICGRFLNREVQPLGQASDERCVLVRDAAGQQGFPLANSQDPIRRRSRAVAHSLATWGRAELQHGQHAAQ